MAGGDPKSRRDGSGSFCRTHDLKSFEAFAQRLRAICDLLTQIGDLTPFASLVSASTEEADADDATNIAPSVCIRQRLLPALSQARFSLLSTLSLPAERGSPFTRPFLREDVLHIISAGASTDSLFLISLNRPFVVICFGTTGALSNGPRSPRRWFLFHAVGPPSKKPLVIFIHEFLYDRFLVCQLMREGPWRHMQGRP